MIETIRNYVPPIIEVEITLKSVETYGPLQEHPEIWVWFLSRVRDAVHEASRELAQAQGAGPQALEKRDGKVQAQRIGEEIV